MGSFFKKLLTTLHDLVTSKKVWTTVATVGLGTVVKDPALRSHIVEAGAVLVGAQGLADFGKAAKAQVEGTQIGGINIPK